MASPSPTELPSRARALSFVLSVGAALVTTWAMLRHGWVSFDEGLIGVSAEQVLRGALPHTDFAYPYSGGQPWLHALAMRLFGVHLMAPRYMLFAAFAAWLPAVWWLAVRRVGATGAAVLTLLAAWWSLTVYPAATPTWYVLFCATWMLVALERYGVSANRRWLFAAGLCAGVAIVFKQTGLYLVAAAMLGVLFHDQARVRAAQATHAAGAAGAGGVDGAVNGRTDFGVVMALGMLAAIVLRLLSPSFASSGELLLLAAPVLAVLIAAASRERELTVHRAARWRELLSKMAVLAAGIALPVALFVLPYLARGTAGDLLPLVVAAGLSRLRNLQVSLPGAWELLRHSWLLLLAAGIELRFGDRRGARPVAVLLALGAGWLSSRGIDNYLRTWDAALLVLPIGVLVVVAATWRRSVRELAIVAPLQGRLASAEPTLDGRAGLAGLADAPLLTLAAVTAFQSLNQFPYAAPNYFAYVAPLAFLTAAAAAARLGVHRRLVLITGTLLLFGGVLNRIGSVHTVGVGPVWWDDAHPLPTPRGRLLVTRRDSAAYTRLTALVAQHRGTGTLYAGPELPEVYFLTGSPVPTHEPFEFIPRAKTDSAGLETLVDTARATMIVLKVSPMFLPPTPPAVHAWLAARFPHAELVDSLFEVRWR